MGQLLKGHLTGSKGTLIKSGFFFFFWPSDKKLRRSEDDRSSRCVFVIVSPQSETKHLRVFAHPPHNSNHHGDDDCDCQQGTDHDADYLSRTQALCRRRGREADENPSCVYHVMSDDHVITHQLRHLQQPHLRPYLLLLRLPSPGAGPQSLPGQWGLRSPRQEDR